ncbi:MAG: signal peptidase II [Caldisericia bacterium]|nr:signal peptidase II [Caldisericia bacterium]
MKFIIFIIFSCIFVFLDRLSKIFVIKNIKYGESIKILGDFLKFERVDNRGGIFGIFPDGKIFFIVFSILALFLIFIFLFKYKFNSCFLIFLISLIFSGIVGNLIDRILYGFVVDFISVKNFPVFNLSDTYITVGVVLIVVYLWKKEL